MVSLRLVRTQAEGVCNRGQRKGVGSKGDEVTGGRRKLDNDEKLHNLYSSRNVIKMIKFLNFLGRWDMKH